MAAGNLRKNKQTYFPFILSCICCILTFYILLCFGNNPDLDKMPGASSLSSLFSMGMGIVAIFSVIFLFYTNNFLIKRRKNELGLYSVLGMEKKHIGKILLYETIMITIISLVLGISVGTLLGKLLFRVLLNILAFTTVVDFVFSWEFVSVTCMFYIPIFILLLLNNIFQVGRSDPAMLLQGSKQGEREPKASWVLTLIGVASLGAGYKIALDIVSPLQALSAFFIAVILVIIGTYALFISGSITVLKLLKKKKKFYYKPKNFIAVSGMIYRMKQNAAGLASICILSTMVLVTVTTTVSLYVGTDAMLESRFPVDISVGVEKKATADQLAAKAIALAKRHHVRITKLMQFYSVPVSVLKEGNSYQMLQMDTPVNKETYEKINSLYLIPLEDVNRTESKNFELKDNEILFYTVPESTSEKEIEMGGIHFHVKQQLNTLEIAQVIDTDIVGGSCYAVVKDRQIIRQILTGYQMPEYERLNNNLMLNLDGDYQNRLAFAKDFVNSRPENEAVQYESRDMQKDEWNIMYGGFLYIGIFLGSLFLMATVLIIYYKQISEGYEDRRRFEIMQQVGMDKREVRKTISKQILMVFFLPLLTAGIHLCFAFNILSKLLAIFNLVDTALIIWCMLITSLIFAGVYIIIYSLTARTYYRIVE